MKLRDYQQAAVDAAFKTWQTNKSCLIILPTGCGKTVVFGEIIRRILANRTADNPDPRVMVLAHREELIAQAKEKVGALVGCTEGVHVEMGNYSATQMFGEWPPVIVSTVQTQITGRLNKFDPEDFDCLVIDEAHHATSKSYRTCIDHYLANPACRLLGVTATPDRADETALGNVFDAVAYEYSVTDAIRDGWLVPVRQKLVEVSSLDFSRVSTCAGDFNQGELSAVMEEEMNLYGIASPTIDICGERRAIVFAVTVKQAERLAEIINRTRPGKAAWICGKTPKTDRKETLDRFKAGELQYVVNVGVLTEGFDDAGVEVVVMARPTKSRALYAQMAGRATRPAAEIASRLGEVGKLEVEKRGGGGQWNLTSCSAGQHKEEGDHHCPPPPTFSTSSAAARRALIAKSSKPSCLIVDFVGNSGRHKLVSMVDILGGKAIDPDEEAAREIARRKCTESDQELDALEELDKARTEIEDRKLADANRRAFIRVSAKFHTRNVDPFDVFDLGPSFAQAAAKLDERRPSFRQRAIIREKLGIDPDALSNAQSMILLDEYFSRLKFGLATVKQTKLLRRHGFTTPMSFEEASENVTRIMNSRRRYW